MDTPWQFKETAFSPDRARVYESLFTLGSGRLHLRGSLEEHLLDEAQDRTYSRSPTNVTAEEFPDQKARWGTFVPGLFAPHPLLKKEMVNLPWFLDLTPFVGGEKCDMVESRIDRYSRVLDMKRALLTRTFRWQTAQGPVVTLRFERFVSLVRPALCVQRLTLISDVASPLTVQAGIDAAVRTNGFDHFASVSVDPEKRTEIAGPEIRHLRAGVRCRVRTDGGDEVTVLSRVAASGDVTAPGDVPPPGAIWRFDGEPRRGRLEAAFTLDAGKPLVIEKRTALSTSRDIDYRVPEAILDEAAVLTWEELLSEHCAAWEARWERSDVVIEGDEESQRALRLALFHLLRAHVPGDARVAIDAKGYSGDAYFGRFFWDTEIFLLPFYLYTDPARARTLVGYRVGTLDGARRNATLHGGQGARFPWEADDAGDECCPGPAYADHEIHVTGAVAHGQAHYAAAGDSSWLHGPAAGLVVEAARFWLGRIGTPRLPGTGPLSLGQVMGPDEYTPLSDNNAYTNRIAAFTLDLASRVGGAGGASQAERRAFADASSRLPLPRSADGRLVLQCDAFDRLEEPRFEELWADRSLPFAANVPEEQLHRSKCLKQADVLMMMALFPEEFTDDEVRAAWEYYLPFTTHDSSLSAPIHAIVALRLGLDGEAFDFWRRSAAIDGDAARGGTAEGIHIATCGGLWQTAVLGFAGMKTALRSDTLSLRPRLPGKWKRLAFPVVWKGCPVYIDLLPGRCRVSNRGSADLPVTVCGRRATVAAGGVHDFDTGRDDSTSIERKGRTR